MTKLSVFAAMLVLPLSAGPCSSEGTQSGGKLISEDAMKAISAELYPSILFRACRNGWRFSRNQIENGFKRHLGEIRLHLIDQGYAIVPDMKAQKLSHNVFEMAFVAKRHPVGARQFGCSRQYWLDE